MVVEKKEVVLVLNAGSSSLKYALFSHDKQCTSMCSGHIDGIGLKTCVFKLSFGKENIEEECKVDDHVHAVLKAMHSLTNHHIIDDLSQIACVGHRVVHGGEKFSKPTKITASVLQKIKDLSVLAPLHNPPAVAGILALEKLLPKKSQFAVFDTAFHHSIPREAFLYGIPLELYEQKGIRKYGFHGISHEFVADQAKMLLGKNQQPHELITCHLGNGSSITAIKDGLSIDTSMGFTPLDGLIMGTRSGELDPEIIIHLIKNNHYTLDEVEELLNKKSGLKGLTGDSDVREIYKRSKRGDKDAILALDMLAYRIAKYIGAYAAACSGLDAIVFTGGIGQNAFYLRKKACAYLKHLGVKIDTQSNRNNETIISTKESKVNVLVIKTDEEYAIAKKISLL